MSTTSDDVTHTPCALDDVTQICPVFRISVLNGSLKTENIIISIGMYVHKKMKEQQFDIFTFLEVLV